MKMLFKIFHRIPLFASLAAALLALSIFSGSAKAMIVPAAPHQEPAVTAAGSDNRATDLAKIQAVLESKIIHQKLLDYGLSSEEAMERVNNLSDSQVTLLATNLEALQAGGDRSVSLVVVLLLVIIILILI
ncbi:MAG: PA2779 family protein [Nitrospirae bacterium]|nr:PA2779 family protein [Nitrospirota bacterium]